MTSRLPGVREPEDAYRLHERDLIHHGSIFRVFLERVTMPNGVETEQEVLEYPCSVSVIPVLETGDVAQLVLLEQFRNPLRGSIHEIPAGMMEAGEEPLACARRELAEETGYVAGRWTHVTTVHPTPGISASRMVYFLAEELEAAGEQRLEPTECLQVVHVPLDGLIDRHVHGRDVPGIPDIVDAKTHIAIYYLAAIRGGRPA